MKWLIASDIHGSAYYCRKVIEAFEREGAERLLLLGDVLYHGPRNDLPRDYLPREAAAQLNAMADRVLGVRGNCDAEIDQTVLAFPNRTLRRRPRGHRYHSRVSWGRESHPGRRKRAFPDPVRTAVPHPEGKNGKPRRLQTLRTGLSGV